MYQIICTVTIFGHTPTQTIQEVSVVHNSQAQAHVLLFCPLAALIRVGNPGQKIYYMNI